MGLEKRKNDNVDSGEEGCLLVHRRKKKSLLMILSILI